MSTPKPIQFRLPDDDYDIVEAWAEAAGETIGPFVKNLIQRRVQRFREEATTTNTTPPPPPHTWTYGQWTPNIQRTTPQTPSA